MKKILKLAFASGVLGGSETRLFEISVGNIFLDTDRVYGYEPEVYVSDQELFIDPTGADSSKVVLVYFLGDFEPSISVIGGGTVTKTGGDFVAGLLCIYRISYSGSVYNYSITPQF